MPQKVVNTIFEDINKYQELCKMAKTSILIKEIEEKIRQFSLWVIMGNLKYGL